MSLTEEFQERKEEEFLDSLFLRFDGEVATYMKKVAQICGGLGATEKKNGSILAERMNL